MFDQDERGPDDDLRLEFEATSQLPSEGRQLVRQIIQSVLVNYQLKRLATTPTAS